MYRNRSSAVVIAAGFSGLKMKDWDKALEPQQAGADGVSGSDSDEAVEW